MKGIRLHVAKLKLRIFIEAAGHHQTVPGYYAGVPHFPAMVYQFVFDAERAVAVVAVQCFLPEGRDQQVRVAVDGEPVPVPSLPGERGQRRRRERGQGAGLLDLMRALQSV